MRCHRTRSPRKTLAWRTAGREERRERGGGRERGQELSVGLDTSLLEVVGLGLMTCAEVRLVRQVHTLFVRSAQQVVHELQVQEEVEGVRQEVREVKGESKVEESRSLHEHMWMTWMTNTRLMT